MKKTVIMFAALTMILSGCSNKKENKKTLETQENVKVQTLEKSVITRDVEYSTTLQGYETQNVSPSVQGTIEHIYVEPGARVQQGQLLVRMDQTQLNTQKLALSNLGVELGRVETLYKSGNITQQVYDQTQTQYSQLQEEVDFLQKNTFVKAPFPGVIATKNFEDGELYSPQLPVLVLTQLSKLKAYVNIPESYFPKVKKGMGLDILCDIYKNEIFNGKIEEVFPTIDPQTHTFQAKLVIPNASEKLRPGMFVRTTLSLGKIEAVIVPYQAVLKQQGSNDRYVFVASDSVAKRISVRLGQRFDDQIEILSDSIREGDKLVIMGQARLVDGVKLNVEK
ncbi:MAG: efflux RND transporter periplasmic adaptor subunit [Prevotellaceae bacterium]|jgi:RND family efflux transporter MFP subunit|nr:efflux RND transporter periplasmic adaptor subunit [Prevotellaceae bacterium]